MLAAGLALIVVVIGDERQYQRRTGAAGIADVSHRSHSVYNAYRCWCRRSTYDFHGSKLMPTAYSKPPHPFALGLKLARAASIGDLRALVEDAGDARHAQMPDQDTACRVLEP